MSVRDCVATNALLFITASQTALPTPSLRSRNEFIGILIDSLHFQTNTSLKGTSIYYAPVGSPDSVGIYSQLYKR